MREYMGRLYCNPSGHWYVVSESGPVCLTMILSALDGEQVRVVVARGKERSWVVIDKASE